MVEYFKLCYTKYKVHVTKSAELISSGVFRKLWQGICKYIKL